MEHIALFPGTFDPITLGHLDIVKRSAHLFSKVVLGVAESPAKHTMFTLEERVALVQESCKAWDNVEAIGFKGMLPDFVKEIGASVLVRGVRSIADCDYEIQLTGMYHMVLPELEIVMLPPNGNLSFVSSSLVRDVIRHQGDVSLFVPKSVNAKVLARYAANASALH